MNNYFVTEDSNPAPLGASLGWVLQLDGDNRRNTFLNAPWVKAVIPIKAGREQAALNWLQKAGAEGSADLDAIYPNTENAANLGTAANPKTVREVLEILAAQVKVAGTDFPRVSDRVFERGFDPLDGGFQVPRAADRVFDQWTEVLPTDQIVAVEYEVP